MRRALVAVLILAAALASDAFARPHASKAAAAARKSASQRHAALAAVKSWGINLRYMNERRIIASPFDLVVVDYAPYRHLTFEFPYERADVERMQRKPDGSRRLVLAYLSIGEAEDYRYYWNRAWDEGSRPAWVGPENPKWPGNFPARFWLPDWQRLIAFGPASYLDRIIAAGFDGVYLDRADVYEEWEKERPRAEAEMANFVVGLATHARQTNPDFLVVLQNAEELLARRTVRDAIDAFAKEDLVFGAEAQEQANTTDMVGHTLRLMRRARRSGLPVLVLEYLADPLKVAEARRRITAEGFLPHFAERSLHTLSLSAPDDATPPPAATGAPQNAPN